MDANHDDLSGRDRSPKRVITDAYYFAIGVGDKPRELKLSENIQVYGAQAVLGRTMYYREIHRCNIARTVYSVKLKSFDTDNWATWTEKNPDQAELLVNVERMIAELEENA
jgi:hypothetical protein